MQKSGEVPVDKSRMLYPSIIRLIVLLVVLGIIYIVLVSLPGMGETTLGKVKNSAIVSAIFGLVVASIVFKFALEVNSPIRSALPPHPEIAVVITNLLFVGAIWVVYVSLSGVVTPSLTDGSWAYPLLFLAIALVPTIRITHALLRSTDKWSSILSKKIEKLEKELVACPKCGENISVGAKFCNHCGTKLEKKK